MFIYITFDSICRFDTSLNKPIWYTGKNWVDLLGKTV